MEYVFRMWTCEGCRQPNRGPVSLDWTVRCEFCGRLVKMPPVESRPAHPVRRFRDSNEIVRRLT
jgi:hypothetical protein